MIHRCAALLLSLLLIACAAPTPPGADATPWHDDAFAAPSEPLRSDDVFDKLGVVPDCVTERLPPVILIVPLLTCAALARASVSP